MDLTSLKMIDILKDLKNNHHVVGIKCEFEAEGVRFEEALKLKNVVSEANLDLTIKIGGCEALKDIYNAKLIGANTIVAPMIETPYAMKKFALGMDSIFSPEERVKIKALINIETITGFNNFDEMIQSKYFKNIDGIVIGRSDLAGSLDLTCRDVNSQKILSISQEIAKKTAQRNKELVVGGAISAESLPFLKSLPENTLHRFETRKVIFDAKVSLNDSSIIEGMKKAMDFELMWIETREDFCDYIAKIKDKRVQMLKSRQDVQY